jgi:uncharacterized membrane protein
MPFIELTKSLCVLSIVVVSIFVALLFYFLTGIIGLISMLLIQPNDDYCPNVNGNVIKAIFTQCVIVGLLIEVGLSSLFGLVITFCWGCYKLKNYYILNQHRTMKNEC